MIEIIFEVTEDEVDGGYSANALGYGIHTQGGSLEEIRHNVKEAVDCYFDEAEAIVNIKVAVQEYLDAVEHLLDGGKVREIEVAV